MVFRVTWVQDFGFKFRVVQAFGLGAHAGLGNLCA